MVKALNQGKECVSFKKIGSLTRKPELFDNIAASRRGSQDKSEGMTDEKRESI
jgi:hypothetical protein